MFPFLRTLQSIALLFVACCGFSASAAEVTFYMSATPGAPATVSVFADSTEPLFGFAYGICATPTGGTVSSVVEGAAVTTLPNPASFFQVEYYTSSGLPGAHTVGCVTDPLANMAIAPGSGLELTQFQMAAPGLDSIDLSFCDTLGSPAIQTAFLTAFGYSSPSTSGVTVDFAQSFSRGDCNADGTFNIADAVRTLNLLFAGGTAVDCNDACDCNDDESLNIADAVCKLTALFGSGPGALPPPFGSCGADPMGSTLDCGGYSACP